MKLRFLSTLLIILLLIVPLGAQSKVEILYMRWGDLKEIEAEKKIVEAFNQSQNKIFVRLESAAWGAYWQQLQNRIAAGNAPDVMLISGAYFIDLASKGVFLDITDWMDKEINIKNYYYTPDVCEWDGKKYAMVRDIHLGGVMYYNKDLFDKYKVRYPDWTWDWNKWLDAAKKLTIDENKDGVPEIWGLYIPTWGEGGLYPIIWSAGGEILTKDKKTCVIYSNPKSLEGLKFMYDIRYKYKVCPSESFMQGLADPFMTGNFAMTTGITSFIVGYKKLPFRWGIAPIPSGPAGRYMTANQLSLAIYSKTKYPREAWEFIKFAVGPKGQEIMGKEYQAIPALKTKTRVYFDEENIKPALKIFELYEKGQLRSLMFTPSWLEWNNMLETTLGYAWQGKVDIEKAAKTAEERVNKILKEAWDKLNK
jgi:multiple sugar transport system substrate-binding protein